MMPTFFARKYMRKLEEVSLTEKVLGGVLLVVLLGIVVLMIFQSATDKHYVFNVDEAALQTRAPSRNAAVAAQMLPAPEAAGWRAMGEAEVIPVGDAPTETPVDSAPSALDALPQDAEAFGARHGYRRRYETTGEKSATFMALVLDMGTPQQAFGLWWARQPAEADALTVGQDGWLAADGSGAGFWDGRYYTELRCASPGDAFLQKPVLIEAANVLASSQLHFGRPFAAEAMLPPQGRVAGSLRYLHRSAFGIDSLDKVFAVDMIGGVTAWVTDAGSPRNAERILDRISAPPQTGVAPPGEYDPTGDALDAPSPTAHEGPLTVVERADGVIAVFALGQYVHGAHGTDRAAVIATAMSAHASAVPTSPGVGAGAVPTIADAATSSDNPFPDPGVEGWNVPRTVSRFTPDNLYVKIDGRAGAYLQFHVKSLTFGTYYHSVATDRTADVYWYDMSEPVNAFGIYGFEAAHEASPVSVGNDGYQVAGAVFFWKGASYVQVLPSAQQEADAEAALAIAAAIAEGIPDEGQDLWALSVLPQAGRIAGSFTYVAQDAFGLDFLNDVFTIDYDADGGRITLFVRRAEDDAACNELFDRYVVFFERYGRVIWKDPDASRRIVAGDVSGIVDVVFARGRYLGGAAGAENADAAQRAALAFFDELASR